MEVAAALATVLLGGTSPSVFKPFLGGIEVGKAVYTVTVGIEVDDKEDDDVTAAGCTTGMLDYGLLESEV